MKKNIEILICSVVLFLILLFGENTIYAAQAIDSNYTGYYVGQLTSYRDPLGVDGFKFEIDNQEYYLIDGLDDYSSLFKTEYEIWQNSNDKTVVCEFVNGKIKRMDAFSELFHINMISDFTPDSFVYQNGKYQKKEITMRIKVECVANENTGYDADKLKNAKGKFPSVEKINMSIKSDKVFFKDTNSSTLSDTIKLEHGSDTIKSYKLKIDTGYVPNNINTQIEIANKASWVSGAEVTYTSSYAGIANIDIQQQKEETKAPTQFKKSIQKAQSSLNGSTAVAVDSNLNYYFDSAQRDEINKYLTVWLSEIIDAQTFKQSNANLTESAQKRVKEKIFKKLGVSTDFSLFISTTEASTMIEGESASFGKVKVKFVAKVTGFSMDSNSSAFASLGSVEYEIVKCQKKSTYPTGGNAIVTSTKLNTFTEQVKSITDDAIKGAYNSFWGTDANKVANLFVDTPFKKLLDGKFSENFYKLLKKPTTDYLKKVSVKCPVDVYIYDWDGNICAEVVNNVINTDLQNIYVNIENDDKYIYLTRDDYVIKLVGNDSGKMEYSVELYEDDEVVRIISTDDVPLAVGKTYYSILPNCELDSDAYSLTSDTNVTLEISSDSGRWSGEVADDFAGGEGSENNPYQIANAEQLAKLSDDVKNGNTYEGKYFVLINDIDLDNTQWVPIGYWNSEEDYCCFKGFFDGNDYNIFRLYIRSGQFRGLFGDIEGAVIQNLNIVSSDFSGGFSRYSGAFVGYMENNSELRNCIANGIMGKGTEPNTVAGGGGAIVGSVGGLVGHMDASKIIDCKNYAVLNEGRGSNDYGGIVGTSVRSSIERCENRGTIYSKSNERIGGIVGIFSSGKIIDCVNYGQIYSEYDYNSGGIVGEASSIGGTIVIQDCTNKAHLNGRKIGGIAGQIGGMRDVEGPVSIINCINEGNVIGNIAGGICRKIGSTYTKTGGLICDCYNRGDISGTSAGGIVASAAYSEINNCYNRGNINGNEENGLSCGGGILGDAYASYIRNVYSTGIVSGDISSEDIGVIIGFSGNKMEGPFKKNAFYNVYNNQTDLKEEMGIVERDEKENIGLMDDDLIYILNEWVYNQEEDYCNWFVDDSGTVNDGYPYLKRAESVITLNKVKETLTEGDRLQLTAIVRPENVSNKELEWSSSDPDVATVDAAGLVIAKKSGTAIITVTARDGSGANASCKVTVEKKEEEEIKVNEITLNKIKETLMEGDVFQLTATVSPENASNKELTWSSKDATVATVNEHGLVTALKEGKTIITAMAKDGNKVNASCEITVEKKKEEGIKVSKIILNKTQEILQVNETLKLIATVSPENALNKELIWNSTDSSVASVDANGLITAKKAGTAVITVVSTDGSGVSASCQVTVERKSEEQPNPPVDDSSFAYRKAIAKSTVQFANDNLYYTGAPINPQIIVSFDEQELRQEIDYTISYENNINIGNAKIIIKGIGDYRGTKIVSFPIKAKVGTEFSYNKGKYKILNSSEVSYRGITSAKVKKVQIPQVAQYGGKYFKVTVIADNSLKNTKITSVIIGNQVKKIGKSSFEGCKELNQIVIGRSVSSIGKKAFYKCKKLKKLTIYSAKLKSKNVGSNAWKGIYAKAKVEVPKGKVKEYKKIFKSKGSGSKIKVVEK